ncbi:MULTISPECIES: hypothetical protein [unclassified Inquilinus]|uniref:hypothetical protein n=1 Tax=unclassified Inquilinus TaxID=2645927 RepID=UPI003F903B58
MDDKPVTRTVNDLQTKDPIHVIVGLDRGEERSVPTNRELKSGFEMAWDLSHWAGRPDGDRRR